MRKGAVTAAVLSGAILCLGGGLLWARWKAGRVKPPPLHATLEELRRIDPRLVIAREEGRLDAVVSRPRALAAGPDGVVYVAGEAELVRLGADGAPAARRPLPGPASALAADRDGTVYLAFRDHVEVLDPRGETKAVWERPDPAAWITSIAVGGESVYVADFGRRTVLRYDRAGRLQGAIRPPDGGFLIPSPWFDVAADREGNLWVAHTGSHRLERYRPDGTRVSSWGEKSARIEGFSGCCNPAHFAIRPDGSFVTSEKGLVRIKLHGAGGDFLGVVAGPGDFAGTEAAPEVAADGDGRILVLDPAAGRIRIYGVVRTAR